MTARRHRTVMQRGFSSLDTFTTLQDRQFEHAGAKSCLEWVWSRKPEVHRSLSAGGQWWNQRPRKENCFCYQSCSCSLGEQFIQISSVTDRKRRHYGPVLPNQLKKRFYWRLFSCERLVTCIVVYKHTRSLPWNGSAALHTDECTSEEDIVTTWCHDEDFDTTGRRFVFKSWRTCERKGILNCYSVVVSFHR